ncbi:MAG: hypothetical protein P4L27_01305 [Ignavibacteriaceae bacterium]|nr:hypothetical protein [Ignavibacteriaceae bacterium]
MKKMYILLLLIYLSAEAYPQISLRGGMGINFMSTPSLKDYLSSLTGIQQSAFNTAINFFGEADFRAANNYDLGFEFAYLYNSFNFSPNGGRYQLSYGVLMPTITSYYVIEGQGYNFKFGGGLGLRFASITETKEFSSSSNNYNSIGFGILLRALGNTALSSNVYANITGDIRYDLNGTPKNNGNPIQNTVLNNSVNLNSLSLGLSLGITYIF